jgi:hypothetical protein
MIIQQTLKGIGGIDANIARRLLAQGIPCNLVRKRGGISFAEIPSRLTLRNLDWHQNRYNIRDPLEGNEPFSWHTPFISTTAGTVERFISTSTNVVTPAWIEAADFATKSFTVDGYIFYCYLWVVGRQTVKHEALSEELRELNVYTGFSPFQPEGEITAKINIPPAQIEKAEFLSASDAFEAVQNEVLPAFDPSRRIVNPLFVDPSDYNNVRPALA